MNQVYCQFISTLAWFTHFFIHPSIHSIFTKSPHIISWEWVHSTLFHLTITAITAIFLHHIQSYSITSHCWPCEAGCHVPLRASWNVTHVPLWVHYPSKIKTHSCWHRHFIVWICLSISPSPLAYIPHSFLSLLSLTCCRELLDTYCAALKTMTDMLSGHQIWFVPERPMGKRGRTHTHTHAQSLHSTLLLLDC